MKVGGNPPMPVGAYGSLTEQQKRKNKKRGEYDPSLRIDTPKKNKKRNRIGN